MAAGLTGLCVAAGAGLAASTGLLCWPPTRHWVISRLRCITTPHRIRTGCGRGGKHGSFLMI